MLYRMLSPVLTLALCACSSAEKHGGHVGPDDHLDQVISRINQLNSRPEWLDESRSFWVRSGEVLSLGSATLPADSRLEMGYRIADTNAKSLIASAIEQRLESVFQAAEEGAGMDASQYRFTGAEVTRLVSSSLRVKHRYWEKILTLDASGQRIARYRIFSVIGMPEADFKRAMMAAIQARSPAQLSAEFTRKVNEQWDRIVSPAGEPAAPSAATPVIAAEKPRN